MTSMGIKPGDAVLLVEHRGAQSIVYDALVVGMSMRKELRGTQGEMAIEVAFVSASLALCDPVTRIFDVVHVSHRDWLEGRAALAYEELPYLRSGICQFCRCTERRPCAGGCAWANEAKTICTADECLIEQYGREAEEARRRFVG